MRARAFVVLLSLTFLVAVCAVAFWALKERAGPVQATNPPSMDAMNIDMDPTGNTASGLPVGHTEVLGARELCARVDENNALDADEDSVDTLQIDVTAVNIPASNPAIAFAYALAFPDTSVLVATEDQNFLLTALAGSGPLFAGLSDALPDSVSPWTSVALDGETQPGSVESGSGVVNRLEIQTFPASVTGVFSLTLTANQHVDTQGIAYYPDLTNNAQVAVNGPCPIPTDLKVTAATVSPLTTTAVNTAFNVTVDATVHNNGPAGPATVDVAESLNLPADCTTPTNPIFIQNISPAISSAMALPRQTFPVTCASPSFHNITATAALTVVGTGFADSNQANNSMAASTAITVTAVSDFKAVSATPGASATATQGVPFNISVAGTLHDNGPDPAPAVPTLSLAPPAGCAVTGSPRTLSAISLAPSVSATVPSQTFSVTCTAIGAKTFTGTVDVAAPLHVTDPNGSNNSTFGEIAVDVLPDSDGDTVADVNDNCPNTPNTGQENVVHPASPPGDVCDDPDGDGVFDNTDNCVDTANPGQENVVHPASPPGDVCDDPDLDGVYDSTDNCVDNANTDQLNTDQLVSPPGDTLGDACDPDDDNDGVSDADETGSAGNPPGNTIGSDPLNPSSIPEICDATWTDEDLNEGRDEGFPNNDGDAQADCVDPDDDTDTVPDTLDNCDFTVNPVQQDFNADGEGDHCDDTDGDGLLDIVDLCKLVPVPDQGDADSDGMANPCDPDDDNDTLLDIIDNCDLTPNPTQTDINANGIGDACEDQDGDTVMDGNDNCVLVPNTGQQNNDGDALGDACDSDDDNDGVPDITDNCALPNPGQEDVNVNLIGDACEDADVDTVANGIDNCPSVFNPDQQDVDSDGLGDICDPGNAGQSVVSAPGTGAVSVASASSDVVFNGTTAVPSSTVTIVPDTTGAGTITTDASGTGLIAQRYDLLSPSSLTGWITQIVDFPPPGITAVQLSNLTVTKEQAGGPLTLTHNVISTVPPLGEPITRATIDYFLPNDAAMIVRVPVDADMDGVVDLYDLNGDGDFVDALERDNCPAIANGNQRNTDASVAPPGDALGDACDSDDDDDGYFDSVEAHVGTDGLLPCGGTSTWPADLVSGGIPDSTNRLNVLDITSFLAPVRYLGTDLGSHPGDVRWDLTPGKGPFLTDINVTDLTSLVVVRPPWLGGARAFNGPACPFAP